jgi:hypothetical protein
LSLLNLAESNPNSRAAINGVKQARMGALAATTTTPTASFEKQS